VQSLGVMFQHADSLIDPTKGEYLLRCNNYSLSEKMSYGDIFIRRRRGMSAFMSAYQKAKVKGVFPDSPMGFLGIFADDYKAERVLVYHSWSCGIQSINQKGNAVVGYHSCLTTKGQTPFTCRDKLTLTCPSHNANGAYRCPLPGCPKVTMGPVSKTVSMGRELFLLCSNWTGAFMTFNDFNNEQDCDSMCLRLKACGSCHHKRQGVNGQCKLFPPSHKCAGTWELPSAGHSVQSEYYKVVH